MGSFILNPNLTNNLTAFELWRLQSTYPILELPCKACNERLDSSSRLKKLMYWQCNTKTPLFLFLLGEWRYA